MGIGAAEVMSMLLALAFVLMVVVGLLAAFYWIIRKAVAAGIRDAREELDMVDLE